MKAVFAVLLTLIYSFSLVAQTRACEVLFSETTEASRDLLSESKRLVVFDTGKETVPSTLIVESVPFSENLDEATLELMRMIVQNSDFKIEDKTVLTKNKFTVGIPLKEGYFFEATYESKSNTVPRFVLQDKILLITPTGKEIKATDELLDQDQFKIKKSEFTLAGFAQTGLEIHLRLPLVVEGPLLTRFSKLAAYFEYFKKSEIAELVQGQSLTKINALFRLRKAKEVFFNVLIKQPFKSLISGVIMFAVINGQAYFPHTPHFDSNAPAPMSQTFLKNTIDNIAVPVGQTQLKKELSALQLKAVAVMKSKNVSGLSAYDINFNEQNAFAKENNIFIHYRKNEITGQLQTYIVFSSDISKGAIQGLQFFSFEVNPNEFQTLIQFLKNQGQSGYLNETKKLSDFEKK